MRIKRSQIRTITKAVIPPFLLTAFLWFTSENDISSLQLLLALMLLYIPWISYISWKRHGHEVLPLFAMLAFMYWLYYTVPFFWTDRFINDRGEQFGRELSDIAITSALWMALLGMCALWFGMKFGARIFKFRNFSGITLKPANMNYLRFVLVICCLLGFSERLPLTFGEGGRQIILLLITAVPTFAFIILLRNHIHHQATTTDKLLMLFFLVTRLITALSSGWLGSFASIIVITGVVYLAELKRIPRIMSLAALLFVLFFQTGKEDFRKVYWQRETEPTGRIERVTFWTEASLAKWNQVVTDPSAVSIRGVLNPSLTRVSLLSQAANVVEKTPSIVPYQYGQLYSYMFVTLIPRFLWPDKPTMNEANQFYQVAYGLSSEEELGNVSIAVGVLAEGFISFSWFGVVGVMFLLGVFFEVYRRAFLSNTSGGFMIAMGVLLLPSMLAVESQMAQYLGGIIQQIIFIVVVFWPVIRTRGLRSRGLTRSVPARPLSAPVQ